MLYFVQNLHCRAKLLTQEEWAVVSSYKSMLSNPLVSFFEVPYSLRMDWQRIRNKVQDCCSKEQVLHPSYKWLWARKSWKPAKKAIFLDTGINSLLLIKNISWTENGTYIDTTKMLKSDFILRCSQSKAQKARELIRH